jgi:Mn2+/Fe2+ NRAMP family transporter
LALQLPFTLVPLIKATSSAALMGPFKSSALLAGAAWAASGLVFVANLLMFISLLLPGAAYIPEVTPGGCPAQAGMV